MRLTVIWYSPFNALAGEEAIEYEKSFDYQELIDEAVRNKETIIIKKDTNKFDI